jgi:hypothetical protein
MGGESSACWPQNRRVPSARQELCLDARKDPPLARRRSEGACPHRSYRPGWQTALDQAGLAVTEPARRLCKLLLLMPDQPLLALSWSELRLVEVLPLIVAHAVFVSAGLRRCRPPVHGGTDGPDELWDRHGSLSPRYRRAQLCRDRDRLGLLLEPVGSLRLNGMHCPWQSRAVLTASDQRWF